MKVERKTTHWDYKGFQVEVWHLKKSDKKQSKCEKMAANTLVFFFLISGDSTLRVDSQMQHISSRWCTLLHQPIITQQCAPWLLDQDHSTIKPPVENQLSTQKWMIYDRLTKKSEAKTQHQTLLIRQLARKCQLNFNKQTRDVDLSLMLPEFIAKHLHRQWLGIM